METPFWLTDAQWHSIEPLLPRNRSGRRRVDDRRIISGIIYVLESNCRWQDCPAAYGPYTTVLNRLNRWSKREFWPTIINRLADADAIGRSDEPDSAYMKALRQGGRTRHRRKSSAMRTRDAHLAFLERVSTTVVKGPVSTSFFVFIDEDTSAQVSIPSDFRTVHDRNAMAEARYNAAQALITAAMAVLSDTPPDDVISTQ